MRQASRTAAFALLLSCAVSSGYVPVKRIVKDGRFDLPPGQGLLVLHTSAGVEITELEIAGGRIRTQVDQGDHIALYVLGAGVYRVTGIEIQVGRGTYRWNLRSRKPLGKGRLDMRVEPGMLSYAGQLVFLPERGPGGAIAAEIRIANRSALLQPAIAELYPRLVAQFELTFTGEQEDVFFERYMAPLENHESAVPGEGG